MIVRPEEMAAASVGPVINALVGPRPIAWVSTIAADGTPNLAPFSYFNAVAIAPQPILMVSHSLRAGAEKDTLLNIRETGELTICVVTEEVADAANASSGDWSADIDEWEVVGVTPVASQLVKPPRVGESPAAFECRVHQIIELGSEGAPSNSLILARVLAIYVDDALIGEDHRIDAKGVHLVGRMGGEDWVRTRDRFPMGRPGSADPDDVRARFNTR